MEHKGIIISGFAGIGKTAIKSILQNVSMYDLSSHSFAKNPGWEKTYIDCAIALSFHYDYLFISTHDTVIRELLTRNKKFYIVYPYPSCREEYKTRFMNRGNTREYIEKFMINWFNYIDMLDKVEYPYKIQLRKGMYLTDVIERMRSSN